MSAHTSLNIMDDDDDSDKPDLNFGVPKNIKKKPILIPAKGEYKFRVPSKTKGKTDQGLVKETFVTDVDDQEGWEKLLDIKVLTPGEVFPDSSVRRSSLWWRSSSPGPATALP